MVDTKYSISQLHSIKSMSVGENLSQLPFHPPKSLKNHEVTYFYKDEMINQIKLSTMESALDDGECPGEPGARGCRS